MRRTRLLKLEALEAKNHPSSGPVIPDGISMNSFGIVQIKGDNRDDAAHVWVASDHMIHVSLSHTTWYNGAPLTVIDPEKSYTPAQVKGISFYGHDGNDSFINDTSIKSTAFGNSGNDQLVGGSWADLLAGGEGSDSLEGRQGNDDLRGGAGSDDYVFAPLLASGRTSGLGSDKVTEAANVDADKLDFAALSGGIKVNLASTAAQSIKTNYLTLTLTSALGIEKVNGTSGADTILGNSRPNTVFAYGGNDVVKGYAGADVLSGMGGQDELRGGSDNDTLHGNDDPDKLLGGGGHDTIEGGTGDDTLDGSTGADHLKGDEGHDQLKGASGDDQLFGGSGNDLLDAGSHNDDLWGSSGADTLLGGSGNDEMYGGDNADVLYGHGGADDMHGDAGNDGLFGGIGVDVIAGGSGADRLLQSGDDSLNQDQFTDQASEDARIRFVAGSAVKVNGVFWTGDNWTDNEIIEVDSALNLLHQRTGNTKLLKTSQGHPVIFQRHGVPDKANNILGWNYDNGFIAIVDNAFNGGTAWLQRTIWHEIAHNWDNENPEWSDFKSISSWKTAYEMIWEDNPSAFTQAQETDAGWFFLKSATFARDYGKTNPYEDFATSFEAYFEEYSGISPLEALKIPDKIEFIKQFLNGI